MKTKVGTPYYVAPEVLNRHYTKFCDMWSIGVITYILLCGYPPFYGDSDTQIFSSVRAGKFDFPSPDWDDISEQAKNFIANLLRMVPEERLSASAALNHKWITQNCHEKIVPLANRTRKISHQGKRSSTYSSYMAMEKLKKAALSYVGSHLSNAEINELENIFRQIDLDQDGLLTLSELDSALSNQNLANFDPSVLQQLYRKLDIAEDATLSWKDFLRTTLERSLEVQEEKIRQTFDYFRLGGHQDVQMADLVNLFGSEAQALDIMGCVDTNKDGRISYDEFKKAMSTRQSSDLSEKFLE